MKLILTLFLILLSPLTHAFDNPTDLVMLSGSQFENDLRYNSDNNFLKTNLYKKFGISACWVKPDLAERLKALVPTLKAKKLKIVFYDCYRPHEVQVEMWKLVPDTRYVANPDKGSNHNRGCAVDVGLIHENGTPLEFPTEFDNFTERAWQNYKCTKAEKTKCKNRELLKNLMGHVGIEPLDTEWWHYQHCENL